MQRIHCCPCKVCACLCRPFGNTSLQPSFHTALCFGSPNLSSVKDSPIFHLLDSERFLELEKKQKEEECSISPQGLGVMAEKSVLLVLGVGSNARNQQQTSTSATTITKQSTKTRCQNKNKHRSVYLLCLSICTQINIVKKETTCEQPTPKYTSLSS